MTSTTTPSPNDTHEGIKAITEFLTIQLNTIVQNTYTGFPPLVVFAAVEDDGGVVFNVGVESDDIEDVDGVCGVLAWSREWVRAHLEGVVG